VPPVAGWSSATRRVPPALMPFSFAARRFYLHCIHGMEVTNTVPCAVSIRG
jgi:hypothetical protein